MIQHGRREKSPATTTPMTVQKYAQNLKKLLNATPVDCPRPKAPVMPEALYGYGFLLFVSTNSHLSTHKASHYTSCNMPLRISINCAYCTKVFELSSPRKLIERVSTAAALQLSDRMNGGWPVTRAVQVSFALTKADKFCLSAFSSSNISHSKEPCCSPSVLAVPVIIPARKARSSISGISIFAAGEIANKSPPCKEAIVRQ
jgi:hypothetical protein